MGSFRSSSLSWKIPVFVLTSCSLIGAERLAHGEGFDWRRVATLGSFGSPSGNGIGGSPRLAAQLRKRDAHVRSDVSIKLSSSASSQVHDTARDRVLSVLRGSFDWGRMESAEEATPAEKDKDAKVVDRSHSGYDALSSSLQARVFSNGHKLTQALCDSLQAQRLQRIKGPSKAETGVEYYELYDEDGISQAVLMRFPADDDREVDDIRALQNMLRGADKVGPLGFLKVYAHSHSPDELKHQGTDEVMMLVEPFLMSLREYLWRFRVPFRARARIFFQVMLSGVRQLYEKGIAHTSDITLDNVLIVGDIDGESDDELDLPTGKVALSPSIFLTHTRVCGLRKRLKRVSQLKGVPSGALRPGQLLEYDIMACGQLFRQMLDDYEPEDDLDGSVFDGVASAMMLGVYGEVASKALKISNSATHAFWSHIEGIRDLEFPVRQEYDPSVLSRLASAEISM